MMHTTYFLNKIYRSATYEGLCTKNGNPTDEYQKYYLSLARNGIKNIITGFTYVSRDGRAIQPFQAGIDSDDKISHFTKVTDQIHSFDSKIYLQLVHCGRQTHSSITKVQENGASSKKSWYFKSNPQKLTTEACEKVIDTFSDAAFRAQKAMFDGVQLHAAHGYLIHQFIHPAINDRKDEFGINKNSGIGERFLEKIIQSIREKCGEHFPILIKISAGDSLRKPFSILHFQQLIKILHKHKIDQIEISYGTMENAFSIFRSASIPIHDILEYNYRFKTKNQFRKWYWIHFVMPYMKMKIRPFKPMYNLKYAKIAKKLTNIPIMTVGGFRSGREINYAIEKGFTDLVSLSRPFIIEPDFVKKISKNPDYVSKCINCNCCAIRTESRFPTKCVCIQGGIHEYF